MNVIPKVFQLNKEEGRKSLIFFFYYFCLIGALIAGKTARDVYFLSRSDPAFLPYIFIASAIAVALFSILYIYITRRMVLIRVIFLTLFFFISSLIVFNFFHWSWKYPVLYVWMDIMGALMVPQFWLLTNQQFTIQEAKKLFGPISAAAAAANILIGTVIQTGLISADLLLPLSILLLCSSTPLLLKIRKQNKNGIRQRRRNYKPTFKGRTISKGILSNTYILILAGLVIVSTMVITLIEYQFKIIAGTTLSETELTTLFGMVYMVVGIITAILQFFITGKILKKLGILPGLLLLPLCLGASIFLLMLSPVIVYALAARLSDLIFRFSLYDTATQILWLPVAEKVKRFLKPMIDGTLKNSIQGLTGLLIIAMLSWASADFINYLLFSLIIFWGGFIFLTKREYKNELRRSIGSFSLNLESLQLNSIDSEIISTIRKYLLEGNKSQQLFILDQFKSVNPKPWNNDLNSLVHSAASEVGKRIIQLAFLHPNLLSKEIVNTLIQNENSSLFTWTVWLAAYRKYPIPFENIKERLNRVTAPEFDALKLLLPYLESHHSKKEMEDNVKNSDLSVQVAILEFLQFTPRLIQPPFIEYFLLCSNLRLRYNAVILLSAAKQMDLLPLFFQSISITDFRQNLTLLKTSFTWQILEKEVLTHLHSPLKISPENEKLYYKCLGLFGAEKSLNVLISKLKMGSENLPYEIILNAALAIVNRVQHKKITKNQLLHFLSDRINSANNYLAKMQTLRNTSANFLLIDYFNFRCLTEMKHIIKILQLKQCDEGFTGLVRILDSGDNAAKSSVYEIIEDKIPHSLKDSISNIFDDRPTVEHFEKLWTIQEIIIQLLEQDNFWENVLGISLAAEQNLIHLIQKHLSGEAQLNPLIKNEIAVVTIQKFKESKPMYSHLDKTLFLKGTDLFSKLSGEELFQISQIAEEEDFLAEEIVFHEGDQGDSMYIILQGRVSVFTKNQEITILKEGECFGEMSLLDGEPRSTSIKAVTATKLLTIRGENFYSLAEGNINLIQGIVRILSARLRKANSA